MVSQNNSRVNIFEHYRIAKNKNMIVTIANQHYNNACFKPAVELYDYLT